MQTAALVTEFGAALLWRETKRFLVGFFVWQLDWRMIRVLVDFTRNRRHIRLSILRIRLLVYFQDRQLIFQIGQRTVGYDFQSAVRYARWLILNILVFPVSLLYTCFYCLLFNILALRHLQLLNLQRRALVNSFSFLEVCNGLFVHAGEKVNSATHGDTTMLIQAFLDCLFIRLILNWLLNYSDLRQTQTQTLFKEAFVLGRHDH